MNHKNWERGSVKEPLTLMLGEASNADFLFPSLLITEKSRLKWFPIWGWADNSTKRFFGCWIEQMNLAFFVYKQPTFPFPKLSSQAVYCKLNGPYIWTALLIGCVDPGRKQKRTVSTSTRTPLKAMGTSTSVLHFLSPFPQLFHCRRPYYERGDTRTIKDWWPFTYGAYHLGAEGRHSPGVLL